MMRIYSDMDGYLANFVQGVIDWFGIPMTHEESTHYDAVFDSVKKHTGLSKTQAWGSIDNVRFWKELKPYPWLDEVIEVMGKFDKRWTVVTSIPTHRPMGINGKALWLKKHIPHIFKKKAIFYGHPKYRLAHRHAVLIDDSSDQVKSFRDRRFGGWAIEVPQPWNDAKLPTNFSMEDYIHVGLNVVKYNMQSYG